MKVKFEPNEFEIGKEYHGKLVEIGNEEKKLYQAIGEGEVFGISWKQFGDEKKHWIQTASTF